MNKVTTERTARKSRTARTSRETIVLAWVSALDALADLRTQIKDAKRTGMLPGCEASEAIAALDVAEIELSENRPRLNGC